MKNEGKSADWYHLDDDCPGHYDADKGEGCPAIKDIVKPEKESGEMQKTAPSLSEVRVSKDSSESADHSGFVKAAMSPSGTIWHKWFDRMGERATPSVINATATLVIEERNLAITAARDSERERTAQLERILRDAVGSIKVNDAGDPIERACPWTVEWFHPARELLSLKRGETFTPTEGSTEYVRGFEAGTAFVIATQREGGSVAQNVESQVSVSALPECKAEGCNEPAKNCEYCERHHMSLCGQLHHRLITDLDHCFKCGKTTAETIGLKRVDQGVVCFECEFPPESGSGSESSGSSEDERLYDQFTEQAMKQREAVCTCFAKPDQEHSTYCPREGMDFDAEESHGN